LSADVRLTREECWNKGCEGRPTAECVFAAGIAFGKAFIRIRSKPLAL